jgi:hypothetical protein
MGAGRPHAEHRAGGIGDERHPPPIEAAEGLGHEAAARLHRACGDRIGVVDPHIRGPRGRQSGARGRADRGHVPPAQPTHVVPRARTGPGALLHLPSEHAGIERRRRVGIFLPRVDPAGDTVLVPVALRQGGSFVVEKREIHGRTHGAGGTGRSRAEAAPAPVRASSAKRRPRDDHGSSDREPASRIYGPPSTAALSLSSELPQRFLMSREAIGAASLPMPLKVTSSSTRKVVPVGDGLKL